MPLTMIEKVARAIRHVSHGTPLEKEIAGTLWIDQAKAAIAAMREFTDEMFDASDSRLIRAELEQNWQNVINAALEGK